MFTRRVNQAGARVGGLGGAAFNNGVIKVSRAAALRRQANKTIYHRERRQRLSMPIVWLITSRRFDKSERTLQTFDRPIV